MKIDHVQIQDQKEKEYADLIKNLAMAGGPASETMQKIMRQNAITSAGGLQKAISSDEEKKAFEKASEINTKFCLNYLELAKAYHKLNQNNKAILILKQLINLPNTNEDDPEIKLKALGYLKSWN